jgi:hypothetical protein
MGKAQSLISSKPQAKAGSKQRPRRQMMQLLHGLCLPAHLWVRPHPLGPAVRSHSDP